MPQTFSLRDTLGAGLQQRQNQEFNALRADAQRQQTEQNRQTFDENQQKANTQKLIQGIRIARENPAILPKVIDELVNSQIVNPEMVPQILQSAQTDPESFGRLLNDMEAQLEFALGQAPKFGAPVAGQDVGGNALFRRFSPTGESRDVEGFVPPARGSGGGVTGSLQELEAINIDRQAAGLPLQSAEEFLTTRRQTSVNQQAFNRFKSENPNDPTTFEEFTARFAGKVSEAKTTGAGQAERQLDLPQARSRMAATDAKMDRLATAAQSILDDDGLWQAVGLGQGLSRIPASAGARVKAKIENIQSQAGLAVLQDMRDNSKTGGAVGQVSNFEQQLFQNNLAPLGNLNVSPEDYRRAVQTLLDYAVSTKGRFRDAFLFTYPELSGNQEVGSGDVGNNPAPDGTIITNPQGQRFIKQNGQWVPSG